MFLAADIKELRSLFGNRLSEMLSPDELGAYILVLANSIQDDELHDALSDALNNNKKSLKKSLQDKTLNATPDDLDVFEKISKLETCRLPSWSKHKIGVWEVMSNPFRSLRPLRASGEKIKDIKKDFDDEAFNFNKPFLKPEILWQEKWESSDNHSFEISVLYNKFPFISYHSLIVPDPQLQHAQYLTQEYHEMIWGLVRETGERLPGFGAGYNSIGACASVNHLHFQGFIQQGDLPIELARWAHNGGDIEYPMRCLLIDDKKRTWGAIQEMHDNNAPYSLLYRPDRCYVIPRQLQGSDSVNEAVAGAGWIEECGVFVAANVDEVNALTEDIIVDNLKSLSA